MPSLEKELVQSEKDPSLLDQNQRVDEKSSLKAAPKETPKEQTDLDELLADYLVLLDKYSIAQSNAGSAFTKVSGL